MTMINNNNNINININIILCACEYSEKDYTDAMSDDETLSGLGSVSEELEGLSLLSILTA